MLRTSFPRKHLSSFNKTKDWQKRISYIISLALSHFLFLSLSLFSSLMDLRLNCALFRFLYRTHQTRNIRPQNLKRQHNDNKNRFVQIAVLEVGSWIGNISVWKFPCSIKFEFCCRLTVNKQLVRKKEKQNKMIYIRQCEYVTYT